MGKIVKKETVERIVGLICDKCGFVDRDGFNDCHFKKTIGYGSPYDTDTLEFSICDRCLIDIAKTIKGAKLTDRSGKDVDFRNDQGN